MHVVYCAFEFCWNLFNSWLTTLTSLLLLAVMIAKISPRCDYTVKMGFLYAWYIFFGSVLFPYGLFHSAMETCLFSAKLFAPVGDLLGLRFVVEGGENVDPKRAYVVLCNHQSAIDVLPATKIWPLFGKCAIVAKKELLWYTGPLGLGIKMCGTVFVNRSSRSHSGIQSVNEAGRRAKASGTSLFFFPEGTRYTGGGGTLLPFKKGAFHVALDAEMPVLPVVVSEYDFLGPNRSDMFEPTGEIRVRILPPIETADFSKGGIDKLIEVTRNAMADTLKSMTNSQSPVETSRLNNGNDISSSS